MPRYRCPECEVLALATPEEKGAVHLECPSCQAGSVFGDARGGFECSACDQRFLIHREPPHGYGGPPGPLPWYRKPLPLWVLGAVVLGTCTGAVLFPGPVWVVMFLAWVAWTL